MGGVSGAEEGAQSLRERLERDVTNWLDPDRNLTEVVDDLTGTAQAEVEAVRVRMASSLAYENERANRAIDREERAEEYADEMAEERDRYRLAWISARRRAAMESVYATEALELKDAEIARLRAALVAP